MQAMLECTSGIITIETMLESSPFLWFHCEILKNKSKVAYFSLARNDSLPQVAKRLGFTLSNVTYYQSIEASIPEGVETIFIDGLSLLVDLGYPKVEILKFLKKCWQTNALLIISTSADPCLMQDENHKFLSTFLRHASTYIVELNALPTGRSLHVDGEIICRSGAQVANKISPVQHQFKLTDKTVNYFAKGLGKDVL